ncbi:MAG TPA: 3D domain-containing protein [Pyrinomonadaceae bacterium]|nr:3D domain-containing protein [Pyrinomonadaceae bacterium]
MSRPLLGGGAAAAVLLSASLLFLSDTSVAETLGRASLEAGQKGVAADARQTDRPAEADDVLSSSDEDGTEAAAANSTPAAFENLKPEAFTIEASSPAVSYTATAYSLRGRTASGGAVRRGVIAADRRVLPIGTRVRLEAGTYSGEYVVADTGGAVRGRRIDIWVPNTSEAMRFGRRPVKLTVLTRTRPRAKSPNATR